MDSSIRKLLSSAENYTAGSKNPALQQAYALLRNVAETRPAVDAPESFGQDLYVLCAEFAFQNGQAEMAKECLKMFFMRQPPANQFLCRAYLCQAQLLAPQAADKPEQFDKAVVYILKAISFAKKTPRYHFLVYNASVIYWQFCRPFLKPGYRQYLARSLHQVVKALDDIEDKDYEWRAQLMIALIECHLDAHRRSDASHIASAAASFIKNYVPSLYKQVFGLMVRFQLVETAKLHKDLKTSPELAVFYKICKLKKLIHPPIELADVADASSVTSMSDDGTEEKSVSLDSMVSTNSVDQDEQRDYATDIQNILNQLGVQHKDSLLSRSQERLSRKDSKMSRAASGSSSPIRDDLEPEKKERYSKSPAKGGRRTPTPTTSKKISADSMDKPLLLMELARLCLELELPDLASSCVEAMKICVVKDPGFYLELEFVQCELMMSSFAERRESFHKSVVDVRLKAIKRCEEALTNAVRLGNPNIIQIGCVTQWNLCLPLLQPNLRHQVRRPLAHIAEALENIDSLLVQLRCQVHTELAHCEEDQEQIQVAMENLKKALSLDDGCVYQERLEVSLRRLELRAQLYKQPDRPEDQAAMIIEQARKADSGTMRMKRSLLVKAGEALAPDAFLLVLDSENDTKDVSAGKGPVTKIRQLAGKAYQFNHCVKKAEGHLKRLGDENDRERARLWGDLAKTARKQEVWDVCRVASRFCLLYDDGRWKMAPVKRSESPKAERSRSDTNKEKDEVDADKKPSSRLGSRPSTPQQVALYDKNLIRMMAEVSFINGEAFMQLLRSENIQLNDKPIPPEDKSKRPKGYVAKKPEEDPDWMEYCDWIKGLSQQAADHFLRGLAIGVELDESWMVCSAAAYIWNYSNHIFRQNRHREIVPYLTTVLQGLKKVGHSGETVMLVNICNALAQGHIKPWVPQTKEVDKAQSEPGEVVTPKGKGSKPPAPALTKAKSPAVAISADAMPDLKKAIEVCDFALQITNGDIPQDVVPIFMRLPILQTWVQAKQMAQQNIPKGLGTDDESNNEGQRQMTRAIVAVEMLSLNKNGIMDFKDAPSIVDVSQMIEDAKWSDKFVELQLWARLTFLALESKMHNMVIRCSKKAVRFAAHGTQPRTRKMDLHQYSVEQEMLSYTSVLLGQSLVENMKGKNSLRREAMEAFLNSAKFARSAGNYELVMTAARHYWNTCIPLVNQPIERELIKEPLKIILECIAATADKAKKEEKPTDEKTDADENEDGEEKEADEQKEKKEEKKDGKQEKAVAKPTEKRKESEKVQSGMIGNPEDDLTLRAAMYGVLFQSYADQGEWFQALEAIDQAVTAMPRTKHRLLIFKHRVMVKAKLGRSVHMDIQKFKDESEDFVAHMWRRVALSSKETVEQLASYQSAIEALENESNDYQKVEYLLEFGQWLYSNHFSPMDVQDQIEWAADILLNMKFQEDDVELDEPEEKVKETVVDVVKSTLRNSLESARSTSIKPETKKGKGKKGMEKEATAGGLKTPDKERASKKLKRKDSARSKGSSVEFKGHTKAGSVAGSKGQDSKSEISDQDSEINVTDYVPVVKEAEIGVYPSNPLLAINDLIDVRQLDALIRSHVLLAEVSWLQNEQHNDILLTAYGFVSRLWKVLITACGPGIKEVVKNGGTLAKEEDGAKSGKGAAGGGKDKKDDKDKKKEEKPKPKRKFPVDTIPSDVESWATYDWPDEGIEAFKMDSLKNVAISQDNIPKPMLTLHYTNSLIDMLRSAGYNHLTLPILAFQDLLSRTVLQNNALFKLIHLRSLEICQELDLKSASQYHLRLLGQLHISEEDQALSREEISKWKERQVQVAREEQRVKETLSRMMADSSNRPKGPNTKTLKTQETVGTGDKVELHLGKILGSVSHRDVWTETGQLLVAQGHYQRAREFLNEANISAQAFNDKQLQAKILLSLGQLSYYEAQYGQAINLCLSAQELEEGVDEFWLETIYLLADATIKQEYNIKSVRKAKKILVHAINEFTKVGDSNPNRRNVSQLFCARLEAKLLKVHLDSILNSQHDINNPQVLKAILEGCERYEALVEQFISLRCWREVIPVIMDHGKLLRMLAREAKENSLRRLYFIQSLNVMRQAISIAEKVYKDVHTLFPLAEMRVLNTPVQRELTAAKIEMAETLTDILSAYDKELRRNQLKEERKLSITRIVEEFISESPMIEEKEHQWLELGRISGDEAAALFLGAHNMSSGIPRLKAKSLVGLGRLLRILSDHKGPDPPALWLVHDMESLKMQLAAEEAEAEAARLEAANEEAVNTEDTDKPEAEDGNDETEANQEGEPQLGEDEKIIELDENELRQRMRYVNRIGKKKQEHDTSKFLYMCASECLSQALNHCLNCHFVDLAGQAALEMVFLMGQYDAPASTMMLALYQSCQASQCLEKTLFQSQPDPKTSKLAALLHQKAHLLESDVTTNMSSSASFTEIMNSLQSDWQAWKKLEIAANHLELLKDVPSNYNIIVLQHSPEKNFLFGAILDKPKGAGPSGGGGVKGKGQERSNSIRPSKQIQSLEELPEADVSKARIVGESVDFHHFETIIAMLASHKKTVQSVLLKREYQRTQAAQRQKMLANLDDDHKTPTVQLDKEHEQQDKEMEDEFQQIVESMTNYLRPVLEPIFNTLRSPNSPLGSNPNIPDGAGKERDRGSKELPPQNECAILLADPDLMQLPLEACEYFQALDGVNSISRDFSLQLLHHRMQDDKAAEADTKDTKEGKGGDAKKKAPKEVSNVMTRIPGLREAKQKQAKIIPLDRHPQSWQQAVNTMDLRYIVDPFLECAETEVNKPIEEMNKVLLQYEQQFTPRWLGVPGDEHTASVGEWEIYMSESSSFIFYGMERLLSYIPPEKLSALNIPDCNILMSLDLAETSKSFQRQSKVDVLKTATTKALEMPVNAAMLSALAGIKCFTSNQWNCTLAENAEKFHVAMKYLLEKGKTTGQAIYMVQNPRKVYEEEKAIAKAAETTKEPEQPPPRKKSVAEKGSAKEGKRESILEVAKDLEMEPPTDPDKDMEEVKELDVPKVTRASFNTVCYGMPNLIITQ